MHTRLIGLLTATAIVAGCSSSSNAPRAVPAPPASNTNGTPPTAIVTARFDPTAGVIPFPNNLLLSGTTDLTINIPVPNPTDFSNPQVALNALDGFSPVHPWSTSFQVGITTTGLAPASVNASTVRVFQVSLTGPGGGVTGIVRELVFGTDFVSSLSTVDPTGRTVVIVPLRPLAELTSYMAVMTTGITDVAGNNATPDTTYFLTKRTASLITNQTAPGVCSATSESSDPLIPRANACALEPLRLLTNSHLAAAASRGIAPDTVVVSWVMTTQSISPVLRTVRGLATPAPTTVVPTGLTLQAANPALPPIADVFIGTIGLPYYLRAPTDMGQTPAIVTSTFWEANPGAYVPPFNAAGLSPASTNVTFANPIPVRRSTQAAPVLLTVPNAASGRTRPAAGWPVVMYMHGITRNRTDMLGIAATMAAQGYAVIAIDQPLHGITDRANPFNIRNTPFFAAGARERTFDVDLVNNTTGAAGPDGNVDASGTHFINLPRLLTSRDNLRQSIADLGVLAVSIPRIDFNGDTVPDFDGARVAFVGQSLGSIVGTSFLAVEANAQTPITRLGVLNVPGGAIAKLLDGSATFGPQIRAGLAAPPANLTQGTPSYEQFLNAAQQTVDSGDPINFAAIAGNTRLLLQAVVGGAGSPPSLPDQVVPNSVAGAPLAGTEPLIRALNLATITATTQNANGIRGVTRFTSGDHGSLLSPTASAAVTAEMQGQMASMIVSGGTSVQVTNAAVVRQN
jgi:hypothetical protein